MKQIICIVVSLLTIWGCSNHKQNGFRDVSENPVILAPGPEGEWDAGALGSMTIVKVNELYHMYYEAWGSLSEEGTSSEYASLRIGHAISRDGLKWIKDSLNPVIDTGSANTWDSEGTWDPFVIYEDGVYKMWYGGSMGPHANWGYATSIDGIHFDKKAQLSHLGNFEDIHVVHNPEDGLYYLFYWDRAKAPWEEVMDGIPSPSGLFVAVSDNETNFDFANAMRLKVEGQDWPVKYSHVIRYQNKWVMFYGEAVTRGNPSSTGIAVSDDLINWKKAAFPIIKGHDAEIIQMDEESWYLFYAPDKYFDMPDCDIRLAIYNGKLDDLFAEPY